MSTVLYGIINKRAEADYTGPEITKDSFKTWSDHWFATAEVIAKEFDIARLPATAKAVRDIIQEQQRYRT